MGTKIDLTGQTFGRLSVVREDGLTKSGNYKWLCVCECGMQKSVPADHLRRRFQPVTSCGCYRDDRIREVHSPEPDKVAFRLLYGTYRKRSLKYERDLTLTDEEFRTITSMDCHYCGTAPSMVITNTSKSGRYVYNSIDRKDSSLGYTIENSLPSCHTCNMMKMAMSYEDFIYSIRRIYTWMNKED